MSEAKVFIDPIAAGQTFVVQFAWREGHLPVGPVDPIAIVVDARKIIIGSNLLELGESGAQGLMVPQANVAHGGLMRADLVAGQVLEGGELALLEAVEAVGLAREFDGARDVGPLLVDLIRGHDEALHDLRIDGTAQHAHQHQGERGEDGGAKPAPRRRH